MSKEIKLKDAASFYNYGKEKFIKKNYKGAITDFTKAIIITYG